ncbi:CLUMA_CG000664, isoform A [Clunio marinus]|uniref:CLUMA_CG000664, isoform A n=1 Tax=Clunio marinus TaxID=568069 RepID=A0A1J1HHE0_9DIPT|nr:CLUMA_CG000664, isoform A [Clunio marinus]
MATPITPDDWKKIELIKIIEKYDVLYRRDKIKEIREKNEAWQMVLAEYRLIDEETDEESCRRLWRIIRGQFVASQPKVYTLAPYLKFLLVSIVPI